MCVWRRVRRLGGVVLCLAVCTGRPTYVLDLLRQGGARMRVVLRRVCGLTLHAFGEHCCGPHYSAHRVPAR